MLRRELVARLKNLVHYRYSKKDLTKMVNDIFGVDNIEIDWNCYEDGGLSDYNAMFSTCENDKVKKNLQGDFDIYYLKCKRPNDCGQEVYVTEIGFEF